MATHNYRGVGLRNVGSYQVSGIPYISGTSGDGTDGHPDAKMKRYTFPTVVREITVANLAKLSDGSTNGQEIQVHFVSGSAGLDFSSTDLVAVANDAAWGKTEVSQGAHYWTVQPDASVTFRTKCKEIYITTMSGAAHYRLLGELTNIPTDSMYHLTGSGLTTFNGS
jgi:hypothetical protein